MVAHDEGTGDDPDTGPAGRPERPLPPPPTLRELVDVCWQRLALRHPNLDATRLVLVVAAVVGLGGMAWAVWIDRSVSPAPSVTQVAVSTSSTSTTSTTTTTTLPAMVIVDVAGAIARPGLVRVPRGARVNDVIAAAGGATGNADLERVDRAALVGDGQRVYVPRVGQDDLPDVVEVTGPAGANEPGGTSTGGPKASTVSGPVDVNTADADELATLPGIGPATAEAIITYRTTHGAFTGVDELMDVRGIGPAKLATLRPHVTV